MRSHWHSRSGAKSRGARRSRQRRGDPAGAAVPELAFSVAAAVSERLDRFLADQLQLSRTQAARLVAARAVVIATGARYRNPIWTNRVGHVDWTELNAEVALDLTLARAPLP